MLIQSFASGALRGVQVVASVLVITLFVPLIATATNRLFP